MTKLKFHKKPILPMIMQDEISECGHACIVMVAQFWGSKLSLSSLRSRYPTSARGMTMLQMNQIFNQLGFKTRVLRIDFTDLSNVKTPAILYWNNNHFVVLKRVKGRKLTIHDPALGVRVYTQEIGQPYFTGIVLEIEESKPVFMDDDRNHLTLGKFLKSILGLPKVLSLLVLLSVLVELMQIINPMFMQYVSDYVLGSNALSQMYCIGLGCTLFVLLQALTEFLRSHLILYASMQITESFATDVFQHLLKLPVKFFAHRHLSDIHSKFQVIDQLKTQLNTDFLATYLDGFMIVITFGIMWAYSPGLACIILGALALYGISLTLNIQTYKQHISTALVLHAKTAATFYETLRGIVTIKSFIKEPIWLQLWRTQYVEALNHDIQVSKMQIYFRIFNQFLFHVEYIVIICVGAGLVMSHRLSMGMLLAFLAYRMIIVNKATVLIQHLFTYQGLSLQLQRLQDLIEQEPELFQISHLPDNYIPTAIHVENINFSYPGAKSILLKDINFSIHTGEKIAIMGPSGCGKTTLIKVLMGLEQPTSGKILIDDMPLSLFGLQNFRQLFAAVMQEDELFSGSLVDNITFFSEEVNMSLVYEVAKLACIHDTIMTLPMGYETILVQGNNAFSGGQKQRILLARALYKKPKFLFLDEATSHLDVSLEASINESLQNSNLTQIIVAHRPETIAKADRVINLK